MTFIPTPLATAREAWEQKKERLVLEFTKETQYVQNIKYPPVLHDCIQRYHDCKRRLDEHLKAYPR